MNILFIASYPKELYDIFEGYNIQHLHWPEKGIYGPTVKELIRNKCNEVNNIDNIDYVVCEMISSVPIVYRLRLNGYTGPILFIPHINPYPLRNFIHMLLFSQLSNNKDIVIYGSKSLALRYKKIFGINSIFLPTYGIDTYLYYKKDKNISRIKFNLPKGKMLLYTGRLSSDKNIGALLLIFQQLCTYFSDLNLVISSLFVDEDLYNKLIRHNEIKGLIFIEKLKEEDMPYLYSAADLFVSCSTSFFETFGRSPLESIACGTPVVVPKWYGFKDNVNERCGTLAPIDFLDILLYDNSSYAMVNIPKMTYAIIEKLSSVQDKVYLEESFSYNYAKIQYNKLIINILKNSKNIKKNIRKEIQTCDPNLYNIIQKLKIKNLEDLFYLSICSNDKLRKESPDIEKEIYNLIFKYEL